MRGNSSMEIKYIPGVTYLNMQGKLFFFLVLSVFSSIASGTPYRWGRLFYFHLFAFKNKIRLGAAEHYSNDLQKHHKLYMITVQSC